MDAQWTLIERLFHLESSHGRFLETLDPKRTVTLGQLLTQEHGLPADGKPDWLCHKALLERMTALARFLERLMDCAVPAWNDLPLVFFQGARHEEDEAEHFRLLADDPAYADEYRHLPPDVSYFFGVTRVSTNVVASPQGAIVPPLTRLQRVEPKRFSRILGYRLPHYPSLLGVSNETATQYVARMVGNHCLALMLPTGDCGRPHLHNVTALNAMRVPRAKCASPWEQMVRDECTDPMFFVNAPASVSPADAGRDPLRRHLMNRYRRTYVVGWPERTRELIGNPDAPLKSRRASVQAVLDTMLKDGYRRFAAAREKEPK